jgi:hypothetical protein
MCSLKDKAMLRISELADQAIANNPFGDEVDKAEVVAPFSEMMKNGTTTPDEILSLPDTDLLKSLARIVAVESWAYSGSLLTPEELDLLEEAVLGKKLRRVR